MWMGAHPGAPSRTDRRHRSSRSSPPTRERELGAAAVAKFGPRLPFLLKILAAGAPLSLQVHPDLAQAKEGYARRGAPRHPRRRAAPQLQGRQPQARTDLRAHPVRRPVRLPRARAGRRPPRRPRRRLPQAVRRPAARPPRGGRPARGPHGAPDRRPARRWPRTVTAGRGRLRTASAATTPRTPTSPTTTRATPASSPRCCSTTSDSSPARPCSSAPASRTPTSSGLGVEIMANSDNVLRCGLTPKHVDVPELLRIVRFEAERPRRAAPRGGARTARRSTRPRSTSSGSPATSCPRAAPPTTSPRRPRRSCSARRVPCGPGEHGLSPGESVFVPAGEKAEVAGTGTVFRATVVV